MLLLISGLVLERWGFLVMLGWEGLQRCIRLPDHYVIPEDHKWGNWYMPATRTVGNLQKDEATEQWLGGAQVDAMRQLVA